jgi:hypothetical protein
LSDWKTAISEMERDDASCVIISSEVWSCVWLVPSSARDELQPAAKAMSASATSE